MQLQLQYKISCIYTVCLSHVKAKQQDQLKMAHLPKQRQVFAAPDAVSGASAGQIIHLLHLFSLHIHTSFTREHRP